MRHNEGRLNYSTARDYTRSLAAYGRSSQRKRRRKTSRRRTPPVQLQAEQVRALRLRRQRSLLRRQSRRAWPTLAACRCTLALIYLWHTGYDYVTTESHKRISILLWLVSFGSFLCAPVYSISDLCVERMGVCDTHRSSSLAKGTPCASTARRPR